MNDYLTVTNSAFFSIIGFLFLWDFITYATRGGKKHKSFRAEIVAVGIIGTFWGISVGLYAFDENDIQASVPKLLEGMKTAFATSIIGMSFSWLLGVIQVGFSRETAGTGDPVVDRLTDNGAKLEEILTANKKTNTDIGDLSDQIKLLRQDTTNDSKKVTKAITEQNTALGERFKESSEAIVTTITEQNKALGETFKESLTGIDKTLQLTMEKLSEGASKEIIKALENVITEFNNNLKDQFGENFKQLNEACRELVTWQDNYKNQIEGHEKAISTAIQSLETTKEALTKIAERNTEFERFCNAVKEQLSNSTKMLDENLSVSKSLSESLVSMNASAEKFTKLPDDIEKLHKNFESCLTKSGEIIETTNSKLEAHIEKAGDSMGNVRKEMEAATDNLNNALVSLTKQFGENYQVFLSSLEKLMVNSNQ